MLGKPFLAALLFCAIVLVVGLESSLIPLHNEICEQAKDIGPKNCTSYNFISYALIRSVAFLDSINTVITAISTFAVAIFTYTLWRSTRGMLEATDKTVKLAREEFIASHRPRLRIRNVVVHHPKTVNGQQLPLFHAGQTVSGQLYMVNVGESRADILDGYCAVYWSQRGLPMQRPYEGENGNLNAANRTLLSGESTPVVFRSTQLMGQEGAT
jgi:hypothetical protein